MSKVARTAHHTRSIERRGFFRVWLTGYVNPSKMVRELAGGPAPHWGLYAQSLRALLDSLLLYLPLSLMGRAPSTPSYLTFLPTERYYEALVFLAPFFLLGQWLLLGAVTHVILRLLGRHSDLDQILNITGMAALVVGAALVMWDWLWIVLGWENAVALGVSHLVLDTWGITITALGFGRTMAVPIWLAALLAVLSIALGVPLAATFMRAPF